MSDHLNELFSPARLRNRWYKVPQDSCEPLALVAEHPSRSSYLKLEALLEKRFAGAELATLKLLLGRLQTKLTPVWSAVDSPLNAEQKNDIYQTLYTIEDLAAAYRIGSRNKR
jgi:hypothetical protein